MFPNKPDGHTTLNGGAKIEENENRSFLHLPSQGIAFTAPFDWGVSKVDLCVIEMLAIRLTHEINYSPHT